MNFRKTLSRIKKESKRVMQKMQGKQFVHFVHIGKTGGLAIKYALHQYSADSRYVIHLHPHNVRLRDVPKGESVVFFLRDPISRFISGFYSRQRQGLPRGFNRWSPDEKNAFKEFSTPNQLAIAISSTDDEEKRKAQLAMKSIQHVRDSYGKWFESEDYFRLRLSDFFFIGFQESLVEDFDILKSKLGLPENAELPNDDILAHRNPTGLDKTLTNEAIENLKKWYKDDFKFIALYEEVIREHPALRGSRPTMPSGRDGDKSVISL